MRIIIPKRAVYAIGIHLAMMLFGCSATSIVTGTSEVQPITHRPEPGALARNVGLLRRLVVLPSEIAVSPEDQSKCNVSCNWEALRRILADTIPSFLASRGYEVVSLDPNRSMRAALPTDSGAMTELARRIRSHASARSSTLPAPDLVADIGALGRLLEVDGIVVVHGRVSVPPKFGEVEGILMILMVFPVLSNLPETALEASIYQVADGNRVWTGTYGQKGNAYEGYPDMVKSLFDPIEPALPAVFTRPVAR